MIEGITPVKEFFARYIKLAEENVEKLSGLTGKIQYDFSSSNDGIWVFDIQNGKVQPLAEGPISDATMTITAKYEDFFNVRTGRADPTLRRTFLWHYLLVNHKHSKLFYP